MPIRPENKHRYPKNWKEIRARILQRAGNKCERCGIKNGAILEKYSRRRICSVEWDMIRSKIRYGGHNMTTALKALGFVKVVLTIAHLDHVPENCSEDNLQALCQKCHNAYDAARRARGIKSRKMSAMNIVPMFQGQV